jgi:hypothetical protein
MKKCAIILNGNDVVKVTNLKRKYNKLINNPDIKILEECDESELEDKFNYWKENTEFKQEEPISEIPKYYFKNIINNHTITSIYPELNYIPKNTNKTDWFKCNKEGIIFE